MRHQRWDLVTEAVAPIAPQSPLAAEAEWQTALGLAGALRFAEAQQAIRRAASLAAPPGQPAESTLVTLRRLQEANAEADRKPKDVAVQLAYGRALGDFGIMEPAYQQFHRARGLAPASAEPDYWIAYYLLRTGRARPAISTLERALKTDSTHHASRLMLAETLIEQDRWRDAIPHLERALGQDPRDARSAFNLACLLARDGRADDAVRALERAVGAGYDDWAHLASDPDLAPLASHPGYQALLRRRPPGR